MSDLKMVCLMAIKKEAMSLTTTNNRINTLRSDIETQAGSSITDKVVTSFQ